VFHFFIAQLRTLLKKKLPEKEGLDLSQGLELDIQSDLLDQLLTLKALTLASSERLRQDPPIDTTRT
jgi:hypothetical protein